MNLLNKLEKNFTPSTLGESLDLLSYKLLSKDMSVNEKKIVTRKNNFSSRTCRFCLRRVFQVQSSVIKDAYCNIKNKNITLPVRTFRRFQETFRLRNVSRYLKKNCEERLRL